MTITVNQLLQALQHIGLSGNDEIVIRDMSGNVVQASLEIGHNSDSFLIRTHHVDACDLSSMEIDCECGHHNCHYCGG